MHTRLIIVEQMIKRESILNESVVFVQLGIPLLYYLVCSSLASALVLIPVQQKKT